MSEVATLKVGSKRVFEEMCVDVPSGGGCCSPGRLPLLTTLSKRSRPAPASPTTTTTLAGSSMPSSPPSTTAQHIQRPFTVEEVASLAQHLPKRLKRVAEKVASGHVAPTEKLFSVIDLRDIVESFLAEREAKLTEEYTKVLNERLAEQFRDFTKFNEDFVTRQYCDKDFTYLS